MKIMLSEMSFHSHECRSHLIWSVLANALRSSLTHTLSNAWTENPAATHGKSLAMTSLASPYASSLSTEEPNSEQTKVKEIPKIETHNNKSKL